MEEEDLYKAWITGKGFQRLEKIKFEAFDPPEKLNLLPCRKVKPRTIQPVTFEA